MRTAIREVNNSISLELGWKENDHIWYRGKNRAQVSAVAGGLLINGQEAIQHLWECTGVPHWKRCSQGTHMRLYDTEDIQRRGKDRSRKPFSCLFLVSFHRTESDLNPRVEAVAGQFQPWRFSLAQRSRGYAEISAVESLVSSPSAPGIWQTVSLGW